MKMGTGDFSYRPTFNRMRLTICLLLLSGFCGFGQSGITLHGRAHFTDGTPVSGAAIFLVHVSDTVASVFSGSDGKYAFPDTLAHDDLYAVHGSYFCHRSSVAPLKLSALEYDHDLELDFPFMRIMDCPKMDNSALFCSRRFPNDPELRAGLAAPVTGNN
jgi:hypothetical protein